MSIKEKINTFINKNEKWVILTIVISALVIRMLFAITNKGQSIDINTFKAWANNASSKGLSNFYISKTFADYPPGYIYILYFIGKLQKLLSCSWESGVMLLILKFPAIFADLICTYIVYTISRKRLQSKLAILLSSFYAFNPAIILNSAIWGQVDGFFSLFIVVMLFFTVEKKLLLASITFVVAILIKPQALIFTPILIFALYESKNLKLVLKCVLYSSVSFIILILPFSLKQNPFWIINKYLSTLSSYPFCSLNAFNLYGFLGMNWIKDSHKILFITYKFLGNIFIFLSVIFSSYIFLKSKYKFKLLYIASFLITSVFVLSSEMHERYLFPAIILSILWYIYSQDKRAIFLSAVISLTHFINVAYVLHNMNKGVFYISNDNLVMLVISAINILLLTLIIKIGFDYSINKKFDSFLNLKSFQMIFDKNKNLKAKRKINNNKNIKKIKFSKMDFILITILVLIYSIIAFTNLGSTNVPQSYWTPTAAGENFYIDFGTERQISTLSCYYGLGEGSYTLSFSNNAFNWNNKILLEQKNIYQWETLDINKAARYVKITVNKPEGMLNEIGFWDTNKKVLLKITKIQTSNINYKDSGTPKMVFDEQDTVTTKPSYLTGMIFDEIYHARTAYEQLHLNGMYEWTHPPLGKLIIALGISIFGMNPFGWRFVGTLFGIVMIPLIYVFGKRLFKRTEYAFIGAFLMSFDFMHFTQSRIATIDVFAVFFILAMYYFMYKFIEADFNEAERKKSLIFLSLSGVFFSLGVATKWICLYSAAGLAILLFKKLLYEFKEYKLAKSAITKDKSNTESNQYIILNFKKVEISTFLICIIFFIAFPIVVYLGSYIPFMLIPGSGHGLKDVIDYQFKMYNYHSTLKATHFFESPWWQWPIIGKPMWYYTGQPYLPEGKISSIVCMGNPAIWWVGIVAAFMTLVIGIRKKDKKAFFLLVGGLSQYLPWIFVPRLTFIYHYFATLPFIMLCITYTIAHFNEKYPRTRYYVFGYMGIVMILFILFYPVISGMIIDKGYAQSYLRWFKTWYFYS